MGLLGEMRVVFSAETSSLTSGAQQAANSLQSVGAAAGAVNPLVGILTNIGDQAIQLGIQAVQMAGDFQSGMTTLVTGAGEAQSNLQMVSDGILKVATDTGTSTKDLTAGMYQIESAGYHGQAGLSALKAASEGAQVGNAKLATVANGATTIMTDYAASGITASQAVNTLIATTANGKTTMQALSTAMSTILPTSASVGVSLNDTAGAMATMTGEGTSAASAATYLRQLLMALESPAKKGADALKSIGLSSEEVSNEMKVSLPATLQMITDHLKKKFPEGSAAYVNALKDISGGSKQMQGMLELTGTHLSTFEQNVKNVSDAVHKGGDSINGWSLVQQNFNVKLAQAQEKFEVLGIKIGTALLPYVSKLFDFLSPLIDQFSKLLTTTNPLSQAFVGMADSWKEFLAGGDAGGAAKSFMDFGTNVQKIVAQVAPLVIPFINNLNNLFIQLAGYASTLVGPALKVLQQIVAGAAQYFKTWMQVIETNLMPAIAHLASVIAPIVKAILDWIVQNNVIGNTFAALSVWITITIDILSFLINVIAFVIQAVATFIGFMISLPARIVAGWTMLQRWWSGLWAAFLVLLDAGWRAIQKGLQDAWNAILSWLTQAGKFLLDVITKPFRDIGNAFVWLYGHNTYVKQLCDSIVNFFKGAIKFVQDTWTFATRWLSQQWAALQVEAAAKWKQIQDAVSGPINQAKTAVMNAVNTAHQYLSDKWSQMKKLASDAWTNVSSVFSSAWNTYIAKPLSDMWNSVSNWWNNTVIGGMKSLGSNMMHAIADGVSGAAGAVGDAIHSAISNALSSMGFHDIPGFSLPGHAQGILNSPIGHWSIVGENGPEVMYVPQGASIYPNGYAPSSSASAAGSADNSDGEQHIYIELDGDMLTHIVSNKQMRTVRARMARRTA